MQHFDEYASLYDAWFMENGNVLLSEARLVALTLRGARNILSVGCGSGLFEALLAKEFDIKITDGIEPSTGMAEIARRRGLDVTIATAEEADFGCGKYDTILFNGTPSYITDLRSVVAKAYDALAAGGRAVLIDVPKESGYGIMYNLAKALGTWNHPLLAGVFPSDPYPIELCNAANWRTTAEKVDLMREAGFRDLESFQTLTTHPLVSNNRAEEPQPGCDRGDYVAVIGYKR
ncbi:MAG: class I SAM-dependent methyltransferase [Muribaculaceae bacterium]|nr:class I SAM-dependent methyltransferase [Muribaculaceae bacterium]